MERVGRRSSLAALRFNAAEDMPSFAAKSGMKRALKMEAAEPVCKKRAVEMPRHRGVEKPVFVAPAPAKYRERFASVCEDCFNKSLGCDHFEEVPLKLLLIGHNPSDASWASGFNYANPTNRMLKLLRGDSLGPTHDAFDGVLGKHTKLQDQNHMPHRIGIGFTDVGLVPGNDAASFGKRKMLEWAQDLFRRLADHRDRVGKAPEIIAFTGKRQFQMLFKKTLTPLPLGWQNEVPQGWPFSLEESRVFVLPSSSGRAVMTHEQRSGPYKLLAQAFHELDLQRQGKESQS